MAGRHLLVPFTLAGISIAAASAGALAQQAETVETSASCPVLPLEVFCPLPTNFFSSALAIEGDTLVAGAHALTGGVVVHRRNQGGTGAWGEVARILPPPGAEQGFGTAADISGDTVVVGAPPLVVEKSSVYIYERSSSGGYDLSKVLESGLFGFGSPVAIEGDTLVVGHGIPPAPAFVLVFGRDHGGPGNWGMVARLPSPSATSFIFGGSLSMSGNTIVVSDSSLVGLATVAIFERVAGEWQLTKLLGPPTGLSSEGFGGPLSLEGDTLLVGASNASVGAPSAGAVFVFERDHGGIGNWGMVHQITAPDPFPLARFGSSVALSDGLALVGAPTYAPPGCIPGTSMGRAYLFDRDQGGFGGWGTVAILASPGVCGDSFGRTVGLSGTSEGSVAVVGAPNTGTQPSGSVYVYDNVTEGCPLVYCTAGTSANGCKAAIEASGTASATAASGFTLMAEQVEGQMDGLFLFGSNGKQANPWGNGTSYQCVVPPTKRLGPLTGTGTPGVCDGAFLQDINATWCPACPKSVLNPGPGATVQAQLWYRDPLSTSNQTTSLSDAMEFSVAP